MDNPEKLATKSTEDEEQQNKATEEIPLFYISAKKTMFGSSLPPVVCRRDHVLFTLFVFTCV
jgi:hypothetical protein